MVWGLWCGGTSVDSGCGVSGDDAAGRTWDGDPNLPEDVTATRDQSYCEVGCHQNCSGFTEDEGDPESCMCECHDQEHVS